MQLRVTDGTTTVELSGATTGISGCTYAPLAPTTGSLRVAEQAELVCKGTTIANIRSALNNLERLCEAARQRQADGAGARVFVEYKPVDSDALYRSELYDGRLVLSENPGARRFGDTNPALLVAFAFERAPWWEGAETALTLTNTNGTDSGTSGLRVFNCADGSGSSPNDRVNYVEIAANGVTGTLPAPIKIELKNDVGSTVQWYTIRLANNVFADPANFVSLIEGEAATAGGTTAVNANASGGNQRQLATYSTGQQMVWTLSSALLQDCASRFFRLVMALTFCNATQAQAATVQAAITDSGGTYTLWTGPEVRLNPLLTALPLVDLGALPLPPAGYDATWDALKLQLTFRLVSGTASTYVDCLYFLPPESQRLLTMRAGGVVANALIVDNGIEDVAYVEASSVRKPEVLPGGAPLKVWPGRLQRIYVVADTVSSGHVITDKWLVKAWYRPRRSTI